MLDFLIMSCKLEELVNTTFVDAGGKMLSYIDYTYHVDNVCMQWKTYKFPWINWYRELTTWWNGFEHGAIHYRGTEIVMKLSLNSIP